VEEQNTTKSNAEQYLQAGTILVVDDDDNWCFISKRLFKKAGVGNQVITASNGLDALNKLQALAANGEILPALIFLDIKMPVMDGFEFLEEVTKSAELDISSTRIFLCSSSQHPTDKERAKLYPVAGFISKPLTQENLKVIME